MKSQSFCLVVSLVLCHVIYSAVGLVGDPFSQETTNKTLIGGCAGTRYGCCPGGFIAATDDDKSLCYKANYNVFIKFVNKRSDR